MIEDKDIARIGIFNKPHGINGELSATIDYDIDIDTLKCIVIKIDSINVPFFIHSYRTRGSMACLISVDGISDEKQADELSNHDIYALRSDLPEDDCGDEGLYVSDMIGFKVQAADTGEEIGSIIDIDDSTENILFVISRPDGSEILIPAVDDFIDYLDMDNRIIELTIPEGLLEL